MTDSNYEIKAGLKSAFLFLMLVMIFAFPMKAQKKRVVKNVAKTEKTAKPNTFKTPDFAFPKTVGDNAEVALDAALKKGDDVTALRAAIQKVISSGLISKDNYAEGLSLFSTLSQSLKAPYSQLALLLEAQLYNQIYSSDRWIFNNRTLPLSPVPANVMEWSRDLFAMKVKDLVSRAFMNVDAAKKTPITAIAPIIEDGEDAKKLGLSVYDFMTIRAEDILDDFTDRDDMAVIPFRADGGGSAGAKTGSVAGISKESSVSALKESILNADIEWHESTGNSRLASAMSYFKYENTPWNQRADYAAECMNRFIDTPYCAAFILATLDADHDDAYDEEGNREKWNTPAVSKRMKRNYDRIRAYLAKFPDCDNAAALNAAVARLELKNIRCSIEGSVYPGKSSKARVVAENVKDFYLLTVQLPSSYLNKSIKTETIKSVGKVVGSQRLQFDDNVPFRQERTVDLSALESGVYVLVPSSTVSLSGMLQSTARPQWMDTFSATRLMTFVSNADGKDGSANRLYVVDASNQAPVHGARVVFVNRNRNKKKIERLTNKDGFVELPAGSYEVTVTKGKDMLRGSGYYGTYRDAVSDETLNGNVFTDLSIYHPGDTLGFMGVVYSVKDREMRQAPDTRVLMSLFDANGQQVDTVGLVCDRFGRVSGRFAIPQSGLLGGYSVAMRGADGRKRELARAYVQVAEYKSPTFFVTVTGTEGNYALGDTVRIKGKVTTYSGMPVGGAAVNFDVRYIPVWWMNAYNNASYGGKATAGADGSFVIELPTEGLRGTRYAFGGYELRVTATNPAGETQEAPAEYFSLGEAYRISPSLPETLFADKGVQTFPVKVSDITGAPVRKKVYYRIADYSDAKKIIASGSFESPEFKLDPAQLPSGRYVVKFSLNEDFRNTDGNRVTTVPVVVYRADDKSVPYASPIWIPQHTIVVPDGAGKVKVPFGTSYDDSYLFVQIADCDKVLSREWMHVDAGMRDIEVDAPAANGNVTVTITGVRDFEKQIVTVHVIPRIQTESVKIKAETFRDRITPGARENWKFSFSFCDRQLAGIPVAAVMSNEALNALAPFRWSFDPASSIGYATRGSLMWQNFNNGSYWDMSLNSAKYVNVKNIIFPFWNFYGYDLYSGRHVYYALKRSASGVRLMGTGAVVREAEVVNEAFASAPKMADMKSADVVTEEAADAEADTGGSAPRGEDTVMREVECPLAFFMPTLVTDADGCAVVDFTVPQFNGTWQLQVMGYTADMRGNVAVMNSVASKPVMAQINAPRFARTGDRISVSAMLYNNDVKTLPLSGKIEIFDPPDGNVLDVFSSQPREVAASGSVVISDEYTVPGDINFLGIRVYAYGGDFTDGEQTVIPVLPSSTPVIESEPFYLEPAQTEFSMKIPSVKEGAEVTLQYCDNPVWEVVTALPDISEPKSANILSQIYALYGNAIGAGLAKEYPEIVEAIKIFADPANSTDKTLASNLEKNQNLKTVLLNNTPWVRSAASETMRMQNLVRYADAAGSEATVVKILKDIAKLQNADGGWSWCPGMESSPFITSRVLLHLAMLRDMGYLPAEALKMAEKGVAYADADWVEDLRRYRGNDFPYLSMLNYLYVRSNFSEVVPTPAFDAMKKKGVTAVKNGWKGLDIYDKATAATLLSREKYPMEARTILESLRQYASVSPVKGMWFDNLSSSAAGWNKLITTAQVLEAYAEIDPKSADVDRLRQWLLITKQAENWGDDRETAEVIHAILSSGTKWTVPSSPAKITVDGKPVAVDSVAALTGSLTASLKTAGKGKLEIVRTGAGPAWGGVISQYVAPIKDVKASRIPELSIEKNVYVITADADGSSATADKLKVGDRVRITLSITCDRDMEYVAVMDSRSACMEPVDQISEYTSSDGVWFYREVRDDATNLFIPFLAKGTHVISYDCYIDREGEYSLGIASAQSQYAPTLAAHSAGRVITVTGD